jgi:hypothetical protein
VREDATHPMHSSVDRFEAKFCPDLHRKFGSDLGIYLWLIDWI